MTSKKIFLISLITLLFINEIYAFYSWTDPLITVENKIKSTINSGINEIMEHLNDANNQVDKIGEKLLNASVEFAQVIYNQLTKLIKKVDIELDKLTASDEINGNKSDTHVDLSECKKISETMNITVLAVYSNMSSCIVDKIELCGGYGETIQKIANDIVANLSMIKDDANRCSDNLNDGLKAKAKAILCLNKVGAQATWVTVKNIPHVTLKIANLIAKMAALQLTIPYCAVSHGIDDLTKKYAIIYNETRNCIDNKKKIQNNIK